MVQTELVSFYFKLKYLLCAGKNNTLTIKSESGRAVIMLSVDLSKICLNLVTSLTVPEIGHQASNDLKNLQLLMSNK